MSERVKKAKILIGKVVSNKMEKTISVLIQRTFKHPLYKKYIRRSTKILAHDERNECNDGDRVVIESTRPISKRKAWRLQKIISKVEQV